MAAPLLRDVQETHHRKARTGKVGCFSHSYVTLLVYTRDYTIMPLCKKYNVMTTSLLLMVTDCEAALTMIQCFA